MNNAFFSIFEDRLLNRQTLSFHYLSRKKQLHRSYRKNVPSQEPCLDGERTLTQICNLTTGWRATIATPQVILFRINHSPFSHCLMSSFIGNLDTTFSLMKLKNNKTKGKNALGTLLVALVMLSSITTIQLAHPARRETSTAPSSCQHR